MVGHGRRIASISEGVTLRWLGVSSFELSHAGRILLVDPFRSRPEGARPQAPAGLRHPEYADAILVTHGHWDHYGDVPQLARRLGATVYLPADLHIQRSLLLRLEGRHEEEARWRAWSRSTRVEVAGLVIESYPLDREERGRSWVRRLVEQALRGRLAPSALVHALRVIAQHPWGDGVALHITHAATGSSIFFLGGLTRQVRGLPNPPPRVDVLALPLTQHSEWWLDDALGLVVLLRPRVVLVHHHDDWLPPLTRPADVQAFRRTVEERTGVPVFEPQLGAPFSLAELLGAAKRNSLQPSSPGRRVTGW